MAAAVLATLLAWPLAARAGEEQESQARAVDTRSGVLSTRESLKLKLVTDVGGVRILTTNTSADQVNYTVRIETDGRHPDAQKLLQSFRVTATAVPEGVAITGSGPWKKDFRGRLWVSYEVRVPRRYDVEVDTGAGSIETEEIQGRALLVTAGGNVKAARIAGSARVDSAGGHIQLADVTGDLFAMTGGGHVEVGQVGGSATLHSGGGHIKLSSVAKTADLQTSGGNIYLKQRAGGKVLAETGGGQIVLGEVGGAVQARTAGGGIKILRAVGPTQLQTGGGSIYLEKVQGSVQASTGAGRITAWFAATGKKEKVGPSQLVCGQGDIVVYLPREIAVNIEAIIEAADEHRIEADPTLPLKVNYVRSGGGPRVLRAEGVLNGGGELLKLHTVAGNIKLVFAEEGRKEPPVIIEPEDAWRRELEMRKKEAAQAARRAAEERSRMDEMRRRIETIIRGHVPVNEQEQKSKLIQPAVKPKYPEKARKEGVEGWVWLHARIDEQGRVESLDVVSGHPWLAEAAVEAVRQWRYQPTYVDGRAVKVATVIKVVFSLK